MIPTDMPFEYKRIQFPIRVAFAMLVIEGLSSKSRKPMFSSWSIICGMLSVGKPSPLFVIALNNKTNKKCCI
jgi:hypothetical protein